VQSKFFWPIFLNNKNIQIVIAFRELEAIERVGKIVNNFSEPNFTIGKSGKGSHI
jgi:hypothetical protein